MNKAFGLIDPSRKFILLGHFSSREPSRLLSETSRQIPLQAGDKIVVCGDPLDIRRLREPESDSLDEALWAGKIRRFFRVLRRTLKEMDKPVVICGSVMLFVVALSTTIFHFGDDASWPDGLYRTVSILATGSDLGADKKEPWEKVFVSTLKILGTVLIAAFTAIVTNYLIKVRLASAFEIRRIPERNHIVVCGLGNVGFRIVEELRRAGEQVVALEKKTDNAFISSARRKGAAVVIGDGTVTDVLKECRVKTAKAVIAATSLELVNLEIALIVTELNSKQRVVVRLGDSLTTESVRKAANVKLALSVTELAAPAFVAGLFGDRVLAIFPLEGRLFAIMEWSIADANDLMFNRKLTELIQEIGFFPLYRFDKEKREVSIEADIPFTGGERLTFMTPLTDLEKLLKKPV